MDWIKVSERLPELDSWVTATCVNYNAKGEEICRTVHDEVFYGIPFRDDPSQYDHGLWLYDAVDSYGEFDGQRVLESDTCKVIAWLDIEPYQGEW